MLGFPSWYDFQVSYSGFGFMGRLVFLEFYFASALTLLCPQVVDFSCHKAAFFVVSSCWRACTLEYLESLLSSTPLYCIHLCTFYVLVYLFLHLRCHYSMWSWVISLYHIHVPPPFLGLHVLWTCVIPYLRL